MSELKKKNEFDFFEEEIDEGDEAIVEYDITTSPRDLTPASIVDMIDSLVSKKLCMGY